MPNFPGRSIRRPIPLLILAAAVLVGTFSGVGYAATRGSSPARAAATTTTTWPSTAAPTPTTTKLVFHLLTLLNGAKSAQVYGTGAPQYAVSQEGVVYLAGSLIGPANQSLPAFVMPEGARPGYYDCFSVYSESSAQVTGALHIYANGRALVQGPGTSDFYSLSGVSYVVGY
jgi:hypothetical protein